MSAAHVDRRANEDPVQRARLARLDLWSTRACVISPLPWIGALVILAPSFGRTALAGAASLLLCFVSVFLALAGTFSRLAARKSDSNAQARPRPALVILAIAGVVGGFAIALFGLIVTAAQ